MAHNTLFPKDEIKAASRPGIAWGRDGRGVGPFRGSLLDVEPVVG